MFYISSPHVAKLLQYLPNQSPCLCVCLHLLPSSLTKYYSENVTFQVKTFNTSVSRTCKALFPSTFPFILISFSNWSTCSSKHTPGEWPLSNHLRGYSSSWHILLTLKAWPKFQLSVGTLQPCSTSCLFLAQWIDTNSLTAEIINHSLYFYLPLMAASHNANLEEKSNF